MPTLENAFIEELVVKVILPEGATNVKVNLPIDDVHQVRGKKRSGEGEKGEDLFPCSAPALSLVPLSFRYWLYPPTDKLSRMKWKTSTKRFTYLDSVLFGRPVIILEAKKITKEHAVDVEVRAPEDEKLFA